MFRLSPFAFALLLVSGSGNAEISLSGSESSVQDRTSTVPIERSSRADPDSQSDQKRIELRRDFEPPKGSLRVILKRGDVLLPETDLVLSLPEMRGPPKPTDFRSERTDLKGAAQFDGIPNGDYRLFTQREWDWVTDGLRGLGHLKLHYRRVGREIKVAGNNTITVDLVDPERAWLIARGKFLDKVNPRKVTLRALGDPPSKGSVVSEDRDPKGTVFGPLPVGKYRIAFQDRCTLEKTIVLGVNGFDKILSWSYHKVTVKVKVSSEKKKPFIHVYLRAAEDDPRLAAWRLWIPGIVNRNSEVVFENIPNGTYDVVCSGGQVAGRKRFTVKRDTNVTLKLGTKFGTLKLTIKYTRLPRYFTSEGRTLIRLFKGSKQVELPDPHFGYALSSTSKHTVYSVPSGTYKLVVLCPSQLSFTKKSVRIKDGEITTVDVSLVRSGELQLTIDNLTVAQLEAVKATVTLVDGDGKPVRPESVDHGIVVKVELRRGTITLHVYDVATSVRTIRVELEGYKEIVLLVEIQTGTTAQVTASAVKKDS